MKKKKRIFPYICIAFAVGIASTVYLIVKNKSSANSKGSKNKLTMILNSEVKTEYNIGDTFEPAIAYLINSDNQAIEITDSSTLTFTGYDMSTAGVYLVEILYENGNEYATASYNIIVYNSVLKEIKAVYEDNYLLWGGKIDRSKLTVTATYSSKRTEIISDYQLQYNSSPETYGPIEVKVLYNNFVATFSVEIVEKEIDAQYLDLKEETNRILTIMGVENPSCPKDYNFIYDIDNVGSITANGSLSGFDQSNIVELTGFLVYSVFDGYTLDSGPEETYEAIFPSIKFVFVNQTKQIKATVYITSLLGQTRYIINLEKCG